MTCMFSMSCSGNECDISYSDPSTESSVGCYNIHPYLFITTYEDNKNTHKIDQ